MKVGDMVHQRVEYNSSFIAGKLQLDFSLGTVRVAIMLTELVSIVVEQCW